jgi:hypothetical protein
VTEVTVRKGQQELSFASTFVVEIGAFAARHSLGLATRQRAPLGFAADTAAATEKTL